MAGNLPNNEIYEDKVTNGRQFLVVDYDYRAVLSNWNECEKVAYICSSGRTDKGSKIVESYNFNKRKLLTNRTKAGMNEFQRKGVHN